MGARRARCGGAGAWVRVWRAAAWGAAAGATAGSWTGGARAARSGAAARGRQRARPAFSGLETQGRCPGRVPAALATAHKCGAKADSPMSPLLALAVAWSSDSQLGLHLPTSG